MTLKSFSPSTKNDIGTTERGMNLLRNARSASPSKLNEGKIDANNIELQNRLLLSR